MDHSAPAPGRVAGSLAARARRFLPLLALAGACALVGAVPPGAETRGKPARTLNCELSPGGAWLAVAGAERSAVEGRAWLVSIDDGAVQPLEGLELTSDALGWDERGLLRVQVLDREHGVPEMRWIDARTQRTVETTRDRERMRAELAASRSWAALDDKRCSDGRSVRRVTWLKKGRHFELARGAEGDCQVCDCPGVVFHEQREGAQRLLVRRDLESGESRTLLALDGSTLAWSVAPDGRSLLLLESGIVRRARVVDLDSGMLLDGPWPADSARWIEGGATRYVALTRGERRSVIDTLRARELDFGTGAEWPRIIALQDGRFVVESGARIELCDDKLTPVRTLFESEGALVVGRN